MCAGPESCRVRRVPTFREAATPARAGSTDPRPRCVSRCPAHPRSRGEHFKAGVGQGVGHGLIPARAGSTSTPCPTARRWAAHPRSRGEHREFLTGPYGLVGSSPLARGAPCRGRGRRGRTGLIPARAGSTLRRRWERLEHPAHPRSRGEHAVEDRFERGPEGLIPARAGSTRRRVRSRQSGRAHPRSRGEHWSDDLPGAPFVGSSPLARGARRGRRPPHGRRGLIPARAGSTVSSSATPVNARAHPRSRGEHRGLVLGVGPQRGSSPLARGARLSSARWVCG